jgi:FYVE/RhoGEF/PH domain-containing protein 5/6
MLVRTTCRIFRCFLKIDSRSATEEERDDWTSEIRGAKTQLFVSLNVTNPNSTLTSSASTNHIRRSLQALPFPPSDDRLGTLRASSSSLDVIGVSLSPNGKGRKKDKEKRGHSAERRRKVDHWVPATWIPDGKTSSCMRCGRSFGWRRRRHHCRLCGRCICASCSGRVSPLLLLLYLSCFIQFQFPFL